MEDMDEVDADCAQSGSPSPVELAGHGVGNGASPEVGGGSASPDDQVPPGEAGDALPGGTPLAFATPADVSDAESPTDNYEEAENSSDEDGEMVEEIPLSKSQSSLDEIPSTTSHSQCEPSVRLVRSSHGAPA